MATLTAPTAASVKPSSSGLGSIQRGVALEAITIGFPIYIATDGTIGLANANTAATAVLATMAGVALNSCAIGQYVFYCSSDTAFVHGFTASEIKAGEVVYLDDVAGGYTVTGSDLSIGDYICYIGQINNPETTMNLAPKTPILHAN
jgi:predicted RecA/RadA family phage recombinase